MKFPILNTTRDHCGNCNRLLKGIKFIIHTNRGVFCGSRCVQIINQAFVKKDPPPTITHEDGQM